MLQASREPTTAPMEVGEQQQPVEQAVGQLRREALQQAWKCMTRKLLTDARLKEQRLKELRLKRLRELRERSLAAAEEEMCDIVRRMRGMDEGARAEDPQRKARQVSSVRRRSSRGKQRASTEELVEGVDTVATSSDGEEQNEGSDCPSPAGVPPAQPATAVPVGPPTEAAAAASSSGDLNVGSGGESKPQVSRRTTTLAHRVRRAETGLRYLRTTRGAGSAPKSKKQMSHLKSFVMWCDCGALVEYAAALRAAAKDKRTELLMGDGCPGRGCSSNHEAGKFKRRQEERLQALLAGKLTLITWPASTTDEVFDSEEPSEQPPPSAPPSPPMPPPSTLTRTHEWKGCARTLRLLCMATLFSSTHQCPMEPVHAAPKPEGGLGGGAATWGVVMLMAVGATALLLAAARVLFRALVGQGGSERSEGSSHLRRRPLEPRRKDVSGRGELDECSLEPM